MKIHSSNSYFQSFVCIAILIIIAATIDASGIIDILDINYWYGILVYIGICYFLSYLGVILGKKIIRNSHIGGYLGGFLGPVLFTSVCFGIIIFLLPYAK